jgi:hypothetical protein
MVAESTGSWVKAVATLLTDRRRLSALSENSRAFAEDFAEVKIAEKVSRLYRRVAPASTDASSCRYVSPKWFSRHGFTSGTPVSGLTCA